MLYQHIISTERFNKWVWKDPENKRLFKASLIITVVSFTWLKIVYPFPNFMPPDSYSYLTAAHENTFINTWPIGYSKFLRLVSSFSQSHLILVILQYLLLQASLLYFIFTIRYLLSPNNWTIRILLLISMANPLLPHIANFVSSDCLFTALSLAWFTQLLWTLYQPSQKLLFAHAIILLLTFTIRFMALYYPFISITIIIMNPMPIKLKWIGISAVTTLLFTFIGLTQQEYKLKTDTVQYSAFGGWQIAANALYGYAHAKPDDLKNVPRRFRELHAFVNNHMDSLRKLENRPDKEVGIYYLWDLKSPLRQFAINKWVTYKGKVGEFKVWASMAPLYQQYGRYLVLNHPKEFIKYYIWPNLIKYYAPPVKFMGSYNQESKTVDPIAVNWFGWSNNYLPVRSPDRIIHVSNYFPTLLSIINPLFLFACMALIILGTFRHFSSLSKNILGLMLLIWFANMFFSVVSAPTELRYQLFPIIITITFCGLLVAWIVTSLQTITPSKQQKSPVPILESVT